MAQRVSNKAIIDAMLKTNGGLYLAAKMLQIAPQTIYNRMAKYPQIRQILDDARGETVDIAEQKLRQAILNGEPWAIALELKTQGKSRGYVEKQEIENTGAQTITVEYVNQIGTSISASEPDTNTEG